MSIRVTSAGMAEQGIAVMQAQMQALSKVQTQLATGARFQRAGEDPVAAGQSLNIEKALADLGRWKSNIGSASDRLSLEETTLASSVSTLDRVRQLALQANSDTLSDSDRASIAKEMKERLTELVAQANTRDGQGVYLFSGSRSDSRPFERTASGVRYQGDTLSASLPIGSNRNVALSDNGQDVFMALPSGDGRLAVGASATNKGLASVQDVHFTDASQWDGTSYRLRIEDGQYSVLDANDGVVASGRYESQVAIQFRGASITLVGDPSDGDEFTLGASQQQDIFSTVQNLVDLVSSGGRSPAQRTQDQTRMFNALKSLDTAIDHLGNVRGGVGARLNAIEDAEAQLETRSTQLQERLAGLREADYVETAARLSQTETALQAAQQSYLKVQGLSLFDYMK